LSQSATQLALKSLLEYKGTPFYSDLYKIFNQVSRVSNNKTKVSISRSSELVSFINFAHKEYDTVSFMTLIEAGLKQQNLVIRYKGLNQKAKVMKISPYHFFCTNGRWYVVVYDHADNSLKNLSFPRIQKGKIQQTGESFTKDFDPDKYFQYALGAFTNQEHSYKAIIEFDAYAAPVIKEKQWNDSARFQEHPDGKVTLLITVSHLEDLKNELLSWGHRARVIEPQELIDIHKEEIQKMAGLYE
jgi:predicted DNA-binding transcriptional regulator YafY